MTHACAFCSISLVLTALLCAGCKDDGDDGTGSESSGEDSTTGTDGGSGNGSDTDAGTDDGGTDDGTAGGGTNTQTTGGESTGSDASSATGDGRVPGEDEVVTVFDGVWFYHAAQDSHRSITTDVVFPDASFTYSKITGRFQLSCPNGNKCDHWDRYGTFGVLLNPGEDDESYVEIDRFITAYRVGFSWEADLTYLRPLLTGAQTMRGHIDTWVNEGHENGDGWIMHADIDFEGGPPPSPEAKAVLPVWGHVRYNSGLPDDPIGDQVPVVDVDVPEATYYMLRSFITGHGFGGAENCAEFCPMTHTYTVSADDFSREVWRDNCDETVTDGTQMGTWTYSRAGWCPGAQVFPWDMDVSDAVGGQSSVSVTYDLEPYVWSGGGGQPYYYMSGLLFALD
jgi:hypothetical protein